MKLRQNFNNTTFHILFTLIILISFNTFSTASANTYPAGNWLVSTPEEQGMESQVLAEMLDYIKKLLDYYIIPAASSSKVLPPNTREKARLDALINSTSKAPPNGLVWVSEDEGKAAYGVFQRTASPAFKFKYPWGSKKTATVYPGQIMKMRAPGDFEFSAFVVDIPAGVKLEDFGPKWYAHELENFGTDVSIILNKEITYS